MESDFEKRVFEIANTAVMEALAESFKHPERPLAKLAVQAATDVCDAVCQLRRSRRSVKWDQRAVADWSNSTFGEPSSNLSIAIRANEEMAELLRCLIRNDADQEARLEVADVVIVLCRLTERLGGTIVGDVDRKMEINSKRVWKRRGDGHGQHVRESDGVFDFEREKES